jgi:DNA topoisomerase-1
MLGGAKTLGQHPKKGGPVVVKLGHFGPFVSHAGIYANLPADKTPATITLEEAVNLLDAQATKRASRIVSARTDGCDEQV